MSRRFVVPLLVVTAALLFLASGWRVVRPGEQIVVRRFGRILRPNLEPGLHWGAPLGIDRFDRVRTDEVRRLNLGFAHDPNAAGVPGVDEFLTGDQNVVLVRAVVQYRVAEPAEWIVHSAEVEGLLERLAESGLARAIAGRGIDQVLQGDRQGLVGEVRRGLEEDMGRLHLGLEILGISLTDAHPPAEVAGEFSAAQAAESQRDRRVHEAKTQAETTVVAARATAASRLETARAAAQRKVLGSRAAAERFLALLGEASHAPELTAKRVYLDTMKSLLGQVRRKLIVPPGDELDLTVLGVEE